MTTDRRPTTEQIAAHLEEVGVMPGDRVAVHLPPGLARSATVHACWRVGAVVVTSAPGMRRRQYAAALDLVRPVVVVADQAGLRATRRCPSVRLHIAAETLATLGRTVHEPRTLTSAAPFPGHPAQPRITEFVPAPDADADAVIIFTRGPDGRATGVFYTRRDVTDLRATLAAHLRSISSTLSSAGPATGTPPRPTMRCNTAPTLVEIVLLGLPEARHLTFMDARLLGTSWARAATDRSVAGTPARAGQQGAWAVGFAHTQPSR